VLVWIAAAEAQRRKTEIPQRRHRLHHYAFELTSRDDVDQLGASWKSWA
jgi:hypothetical protein